MMFNQPIRAGVLLACATCPARILVLTSAASSSAILCCRQPMHVVPALWCGAVDRASSSPKNHLVAGRLYQDRVSGLRIRCTQSAPGPVAVDGRPLAPLPNDLAHGRHASHAEPGYAAEIRSRLSEPYG